jgi:hypothetical protein
MSDKKYFGRFKNITDVRKEFELSGDDELIPEEVLFAAYLEGSYSGWARVLFVRGGQLYEVEGSHCSCNGLERQWDPQEVSWDQLAMRPLFNKDGYHDDDLNDEGEGLAETTWNKLVRSHVPRA